jgi:hypothetical protein
VVVTEAVEIAVEVTEAAEIVVEVTEAAEIAVEVTEAAATKAVAMFNVSCPKLELVLLVFAFTLTILSIPAFS